ncbi:MAG: hypothetical protein ACOC5I_00940 [Gemmatimonadota bacterium]
MERLKALTKQGVDSALRKAERYRFLGEPCEAESIYLDILDVDPTRRAAGIGLVLSLTDQLRSDPGRAGEASALAADLSDEYERLYYSGVVAERLGKAQLFRGGPASSDSANRALREAMKWYEKAEALRAPGDDDAVLRWNACARTISRHGFGEPADVSLPGLLMTE